MRAESVKIVRKERGVSGAEMTIVVCVVAGVIAFEVWFLFFANYTLPG